MDTPTIHELLVQVTKKLQDTKTTIEILETAKEAKSLEELIEKLERRLSSK